MLGQYSVVETDWRSRKCGNLLFQARNIGCSDSDPSMAQGAMHPGREVPTMPLCWNLHKLLPWYQEVPSGIDSSCTAPRVTCMLIWLGQFESVKEE
jgi:hypothetical protein